MKSDVEEMLYATPDALGSAKASTGRLESKTSILSSAVRSGRSEARGCDLNNMSLMPSVSFLLPGDSFGPIKAGADKHNGWKSTRSRMSCCGASDLPVNGPKLVESQIGGGKVGKISRDWQ